MFSAVKEKYFSPNQNIGPRVNNFNIIRFLAAAMVIYGHMAHIMGVAVPCIYGQAVSTIAVKILFVISGYLVMKSLMNDARFGRYMIRRSFRIFPGLIGVVLFSTLVVGLIFTGLPKKEYLLSGSTWLYLKNIVFYPIYSLPGVFANYTYPNAVNGSLWTLPIEFALYLVLPLFLVIFRKIKIERAGLIAVTVLCIAANIARLKYFPDARYVFYGTNWFDALTILPYFFAGSVLALPEFKNIFNIQIAFIMLLVAAIFKFGSVKYELILSLILPYSVLSFSLTEKPVFSRWFEKSDYSYGLYLYGFVIQQAVYHQIEKLKLPFFSLNISFLICFVCTFICAFVSWHLIEKPSQKLCKSILEKMRKK